MANGTKLPGTIIFKERGGVLGEWVRRSLCLPSNVRVSDDLPAVDLESVPNNEAEDGDADIDELGDLFSDESDPEMGLVL